MRRTIRRPRSLDDVSLARYLGDGERPLLIARQHPLALLGAARDTGVLLVPLLLAAWGIAGVEVLRGDVGSWLLRAIFFVMLLLVLRLAWRVLGWEFERVVVTGEKVIHLSGILNRRIASTPLAKVSEFTVRQPLLGRMFDYGSLVVDVPGGREQALHGMAYLPDPTGLYRLISDQARRGRVEEGGGNLRATTLLQHRPMPATAAPQDPWRPRLEPDEADHTISIPRVTPPA